MNIDEVAYLSYCHDMVYNSAHYALRHSWCAVKHNVAEMPFYALFSDLPHFALFEKCGRHITWRRAAAIQTIIGTARLNGLDPHAWLKDTLEKTAHLAEQQTG